MLYFKLLNVRANICSDKVQYHSLRKWTTRHMFTKTMALLVPNTWMPVTRNINTVLNKHCHFNPTKRQIVWFKIVIYINTHCITFNKTLWALSFSSSKFLWWPCVTFSKRPAFYGKGFSPRPNRKPRIKPSPSETAYVFNHSFIHSYPRYLKIVLCTGTWGRDMPCWQAIQLFLENKMGEARSTHQRVKE